MSILVLQSFLFGKGELIALRNMSPWCLLMVEWLFLAVPWGCLQFVIVVFPDHTHYLLLTNHETPYNLNIVLSFHPSFEPITALFTTTGL